VENKNKIEFENGCKLIIEILNIHGSSHAVIAEQGFLNYYCFYNNNNNYYYNLINIIIIIIIITSKFFFFR
jgi:hypothetical protein